MADLPLCESLRAPSSQTQQCTPRRPEYTHNKCSYPKSSEMKRQTTASRTNGKARKSALPQICLKRRPSLPNCRSFLPRKAESTIFMAMVIRGQQFEQMSAPLKQTGFWFGVGELIWSKSKRNLEKEKEHQTKQNFVKSHSAGNFLWSGKYPKNLVTNSVEHTKWTRSTESRYHTCNTFGRRHNLSCRCQRRVLFPPPEKLRLSRSCGPWAEWENVKFKIIRKPQRCVVLSDCSRSQIRFTLCVNTAPMSIL